MKTKTIYFTILTAITIVGITVVSLSNYVGTDYAHKGVGTNVTELESKGGDTEYVAERLYDARDRVEYDESTPVTHKNNVTYDELKEKLELVKNARIGIVSSGIDYDIGQLVFYVSDFAIEEDIRKILGDFPFVVLYEEQSQLSDPNRLKELEHKPISEP